MPNTSSRAGRGLLVAAAALLAAGALAQSPTLYRWVDKDGRVHYSDSSPAPNAKPVNPNTINGGEDASAGANERQAAAAKQADCKRRADEYVRYQNAASFTETDALGNTRSYSPEEMDKLRQHKRQELADKCGADAVPAATPPAAAPPAATPQP